MAGIIAVYSLVIAVLIAGDLEPPPGQNYSLFKYVRCKSRYHSCCCRTYLNPSGFMHLAAGLSVGFTGLAAGYAIGVVGDVVSQRFSATVCTSRSLRGIGSSVIYVTIKDIRGHGADIDFWRGTGSLRVRFTCWCSRERDLAK